MFQTTQWALSSEAAQSLTLMAARGAKGKGELAALVRERQDLVAEWQKRERLRNAALGQEATKRDAKAEAENDTRMAAIDTRIAVIDKRLAAEFPDYAALANPAPLHAEEVQAQLGADEALVLFLDTPEAQPTPEETFIWVVTKTDTRWVRSDLGTAALTREVRALRCGLDYTAWKGTLCKELTGVEYVQADYLAGHPLPFDHGRSHRSTRRCSAGLKTSSMASICCSCPPGRWRSCRFKSSSRRRPRQAKIGPPHGWPEAMPSRCYQLCRRSRRCATLAA